jgi:hypothetical protein
MNPARCQDAWATSTSPGAFPTGRWLEFASKELVDRGGKERESPMSLPFEKVIKRPLRSSTASVKKKGRLGGVSFRGPVCSCVTRDIAIIFVWWSRRAALA